MKKAGLFIFIAMLPFAATADGCVESACNASRVCIGATEAEHWLCEDHWKTIDANLCTQMYGKCVRLPDKKCGWEPTAELNACLAHPEQYERKYGEWQRQ